eukprot:1192379-Prorocentrum_minimum.AAC.8
MEIQTVNCFRATRNADVVRNEEEAEDLLEMMTDEVSGTHEHMNTWTHEHMSTVRYQSATVQAA